MDIPKFYYAVHFTTMQTKEYIDADGADTQVTGIVETDILPPAVVSMLMQSDGSKLLFYKKPSCDLDDSVFTLAVYKYCRISRSEWFALVDAGVLQQLFVCYNKHGLLIKEKP